jgi:hypothetical protein
MIGNCFDRDPIIKQCLRQYLKLTNIFSLFGIVNFQLLLSYLHRHRRRRRHHHHHGFFPYIVACRPIVKQRRRNKQ